MTSITYSAIILFSLLAFSAFLPVSEWQLYTPTEDTPIYSPEQIAQLQEWFGNSGEDN